MLEGGGSLDKLSVVVHSRRRSKLGEVERGLDTPGLAQKENQDQHYRVSQGFANHLQYERGMSCNLEDVVNPQRWAAAFIEETS